MRAKRKAMRRLYDLAHEKPGCESLRPGQEAAIQALLVVLFDEVGYKTLAVDIVTERGLLEEI